ncbi:hypothetical protein [Shewanella psychromarinicola]|uniref:Lipoprotein n=1 Tax=Shewanella psychromarinicola TaxID=2487742 RepID=A0A3N4EF05_9GAMM|nr:hypothetical protein [Shewanella psychromarinicola]AZG34589.1 hypothetical protein EGC80_06400 [Shewanella psychromarinicola]MCL1081738.1 hypothetical protein [Shewanella psychromarinicola]RPA28164.1 hypothetical protein EGC77_15730 [Shewanella psychromarinicola]
MGFKFTYVKIIILTICLIVLASCGVSKKEQEMRNSCIDSAKLLDIYDQEGKHYSEKSFGRIAIKQICYVKVELYLDGYRIDKNININDIRLYQSDTNSNLKSRYIRSIKARSEF